MHTNPISELRINVFAAGNVLLNSYYYSLSNKRRVSMSSFFFRIIPGQRWITNIYNRRNNNDY